MDDPLQPVMVEAASKLTVTGLQLLDTVLAQWCSTNLEYAQFPRFELLPFLVGLSQASGFSSVWLSYGRSSIMDPTKADTGNSWLHPIILSPFKAAWRGIYSPVRIGLNGVPFLNVDSQLSR